MANSLPMTVAQSGPILFVFCQIFVGRFGVSFSPFERLFLGRFGFGQSCGCRLLHEGVGLAPGLALESDHPAGVDGAGDDRGGHVGGAEDPAPSGELDVGV